MADSGRKEQPLIQGYLEKRGSLVKSWKKRYCCIDAFDNEPTLFYFITEMDFFSGKVLGALSLRGCEMEETPYKFAGKPFCLKIVSAERTLFLNCYNTSARQTWKSAIQKAISKGTSQVGQPYIPQKSQGYNGLPPSERIESNDNGPDVDQPPSKKPFSNEPSYQQNSMQDKQSNSTKPPYPFRVVNYIKQRNTKLIPTDIATLSKILEDSLDEGEQQEASMPQESRKPQVTAIIPKDIATIQDIFTDVTDG